MTPVLNNKTEVFLEETGEIPHTLTKSQDPLSSHNATTVITYIIYKSRNTTAISFQMPVTVFKSMNYDSNKVYYEIFKTDVLMKKYCGL